MFISRDVIFDKSSFPGTSSSGENTQATLLGIRALWPDKGYKEDIEDSTDPDDGQPPLPPLPPAPTIGEADDKQSKSPQPPTPPAPLPQMPPLSPPKVAFSPS
ncbi:hypothetical protein FRB95_014675 [Tulasnella sp. JGI-2019a]|nr:hypothetical protein FRB95_014675 [Tulasnella sp. JGI-2019a]